MVLPPVFRLIQIIDVSRSTWIPAQLERGQRLATTTAIVWTIRENFWTLRPSWETRGPRLFPAIIIPAGGERLEVGGCTVF